MAEFKEMILSKQPVEEIKWRIVVDETFSETSHLSAFTFRNSPIMF